ncbi:sterol desaturase family protein [Novosphingobium bradum]|uniref:Sterol desaturase family protein n=1 Tax=Novosphingobium bradum TaxID=1737444 RepID=A0ABV7IS59_9SPHN
MDPKVLTIVVVAWLALLVWAGRRWPVNPDIPAKAYGINLAAGLVQMALFIPVAAVVGGLAGQVSQWTGVHFSLVRAADIGIGVAGVDAVLRVLVLTFVPLLAYDLWFAASHRLEHFVPALWDMHKVHHADRWMNPFTIVRDNFMQTIWRAFFPVLTLGLFIDMDFREGGEAAIYSQTFLYLWSALCHSNIRIELPWLDGILTTPQYHRLHHSVEPQHADCNFADIFPVFDMVLGRYHRPRPGEFPLTGLISGERIDGVGRIIVAPFLAWAGRLRAAFTGGKPGQA